ncbi:YadA-like family protein [Veillonella sp. CHU740]|uniref:YadA-like family protein n=1 Tax=Veillonella sp. CHU740 TaxID=2490950 RepID=UPI000F8E4515|nr:YadA-like family protein [Veillonella sp. CHU740]
MNSKSIAAIVMTTVLATGYGIVQAIGQGSYASDGIQIGSDHSVGVGGSILISGDDAVVVGTSHAEANDKGTSVGGYAGASSYDGSTNLGYNALGRAINAIALGRLAVLQGYQSMGIGYKTHTFFGVENGMAIGESSRARETNSVALGSQTVTNRDEGVVGYDPLNIAVIKDPEKGNLQLPTALQAEIATKEAEYKVLQGEYETIQGDIYELSEKRAKLIGELTRGEVTDQEELNAIRTQSKEKYDLLKKKGTELINKKAEINRIAGTWRSGQGAISIGNSEKGDTRQLIGLAAGSEDTDGINVAQLKSLDLAAHRALDRTIGQLRNEARQGNTMTAALAALKPVAYKVNEPTQVLAGVGQYAGHSGYALGVAHYRNERMMVNAGAALSGNQLVYNAGATLRLGKQRAALIMDKNHLSIDTLFEALQHEQSRNQRQKQVLRELELENQQLHQDVEQLKRMAKQ